MCRVLFRGFFPGPDLFLSSLLIDLLCGGQRFFLGVFNVCGVTGMDGCPGAASELVCLYPPCRRITGPLRDGVIV